MEPVPKKHIVRRLPKKLAKLPAFPLESMANVLLYCDKSPRHVFLALKACKGLRRFLNSEWWTKFWARHVGSVTHAGNWTSRFMASHGVPELRPQQYAHVLRLTYGLRCELCGTRHGHRVCDVSKMRLCIPCKQDHFVSNRVLYYEYGLSASKLLSDFAHLLCYTSMREFRKHNDFTLFSRASIDIAGQPKQNLMFFWRPSLQRCVDLPSAHAKQQVRLRATRLLQARIRMFYTGKMSGALQRNSIRIDGKRVIFTDLRSYRVVISDVNVRVAHDIETAHLVKPLSSQLGAWVVGGPTNMAWLVNPLFRPVTYTEMQPLWDIMRVPRWMPYLGLDEYTTQTWLHKHNARLESVPEETLELLPKATYGPGKYGNVWTFDSTVHSI